MNSRNCFAGLLSLVVLLTVAACGPKEESIKISVSAEKDGLCSEIAKVVCYNVFHCCTGAQIEMALGLKQTTTEKACRGDVELICQQNMASVLYGLDKSTLTVDSAGATTCLEALLPPEDECFPTLTEPAFVAACEEQFIDGLQGDGKACIYGAECKKDHYCAPDRKCRALPGKDEDCDTQAPDQQCQDGLYCDENLLCKELKKKGQECDFLNPCRTGLFCGETGIAEFECKSLKSIGGDCAGSSACESGYCIPGLCSDGSQCWADTDCIGMCQGTFESCWDDTECAGTCTVSGGPCTEDWDCYEVDDVCEHTPCETKCSGDPVCGEKFGLVNYCDLGLELLEDGIQ